MKRINLPRTIREMRQIPIAISAAVLMLASLSHADDKAAEVKLPFWAEKGAIVYRVATPDQTNVLPQIEEGTGIVSHLTDGSVRQILIANGIIGHDHPGPWNWDGVWPYWNRVTFRGGDFKTLSRFMIRARDKNNALMSFHLNLTDVNIGLRDYPETRDFFNKLATAKAIYRRDWNPKTNQRNIEPPYVPQEIDKYIEAGKEPNPTEIFALVNYKRFWDSGVGKQMKENLFLQLGWHRPHMETPGGMGFSEIAGALSIDADRSW